MVIWNLIGWLLLSAGVSSAPIVSRAEENCIDNDDWDEFGAFRGLLSALPPSGIIWLGSIVMLA